MSGRHPRVECDATQAREQLAAARAAVEQARAARRGDQTPRGRGVDPDSGALDEVEEHERSRRPR